MIGIWLRNNRSLLLTLASLVGVGYLAYQFSTIFSYIVLAVIFAAVLKRPTKYLNEGLRLPRPLAILGSFLLLAGLVTAFAFIFVPLISKQVEVITGLNLDEVAATATQPLEQLEQFLLDRNLVNESPGFLKNSVRESIADLIRQLQFGQLANDVVSGVLGLVGSLLTTFLAVAFITFFLLLEKGQVRKRIISLIPNKYFEVSIAAITKTERLLGNYLLGLLLQVMLIFTVASICLLVAGVDYALAIALFAAVANLIPYLGPALGTIFGFLVAFSTATDITTGQEYALLFVKIAASFSIVQLTDNVLVQPIIFSRSVKAHPLEIFLIVFVGASVAGAVGMIFSIPTYTILRVTVLEFYQGYKDYQIFRN